MFNVNMMVFVLGVINFFDMLMKINQVNTAAAHLHMLQIRPQNMRKYQISHQFVLACTIICPTLTNLQDWNGF